MANRKFGVSARFDRYFEGYEKRLVIDRNGEEVERMVYAGKYYRAKKSDEAYLAGKVINVALFLASAALQIAAGVMEGVPMNTGASYKFMGFAQCLGFLALILMAVFTCIHASSPRKMELHAYRGRHEKFIIASAICAVGTAAVFVCSVVALLAAGSFTFISVLWCLMYLASSACMFVMFLLEKRSEYDELEPDYMYKRY